MLIESAASVGTTAPSGADVPSHGATPTADRGPSFHRAARALDAIDELARRRRSQELVLALERLGAGLDATIGALDDAVAPSPAAAPVPQATSWAPISTPVVPITAHVPAPSATDAAPTNRSAPAWVEPTAEVLVAKRTGVEAPAPRPMRQAPVGLAAHVIDFSAPVAG